jgi:hypothetical protein
VLRVALAVLGAGVLLVGPLVVQHRVGALLVAVARVLDELGLGRIEWWANVGNYASRRVAEKAGFTMEGTARARLLHRGVRVDGWSAGLLPGELVEAPGGESPADRS